MTAEIAILNKLAVALATDSAVTISAGKQEQKIYDSADKLFDLSSQNAIGIMIYNGMQFMQAPLQTLISEYRSKCRSFKTVRDAANDFLRFLNDWGENSPPIVIRGAIEQIVAPIIEAIQENIAKKIEELVSQSPMDDVLAKVKNLPDETISIVEKNLKAIPKSSFIGGRPPRLTKERTAIIREIVEERWSTNDQELLDRLVEVSKQLLLIKDASPNHTGIVIAGFGTDDKFPSLISFTVDGMVFDKLKFAETNFVDIDRSGDRARVMPFAQKEMVERFLYGLDGKIERQITEFVKDTVPEIRNQILAQLEMSADDRISLTREAQNAEKAFVKDLREKRFEEIRSSSRSEIEGMVEFMPKPELAKMAEALVNLTSIKRRVSVGMETVGGPIDVAVISRTEGFIWVKRKHYFSQDLNPRYISRIANGMTGNKDEPNGTKHL